MENPICNKNTSKNRSALEKLFSPVLVLILAASAVEAQVATGVVWGANFGADRSSEKVQVAVQNPCRDAQFQGSWIVYILPQMEQQTYPVQISPGGFGIFDVALGVPSGTAPDRVQGHVELRGTPPCVTPENAVTPATLAILRNSDDSLLNLTANSGESYAQWNLKPLYDRLVVKPIEEDAEAILFNGCNVPVEFSLHVVPFMGEAETHHITLEHVSFVYQKIVWTGWAQLNLEYKPLLPPVDSPAGCKPSDVFFTLTLISPHGETNLAILLPAVQSARE